jgi:putative ABC transport system permease protein
MSFADSLRTALRALGVNKLRSILTVLGIIVGVAAVTSMVSVAAGSRAEVAEKIRTLGANLLLIIPGAQISGGAHLEAGTRHTLTEEDAMAIWRQLPGIQVAAPLLSRSMTIVAGNKNANTLVAGIHADYLVAREWPIAHGRLFNAVEVQSGAKVAIIGAAIVEQLFGNDEPTGMILRIGNVPFTVIGVLDRKGQGSTGRSQDDVVFVPLLAAKSRLLGAVRGGTRDALDFIMIKAQDTRNVATLKTDIKALLRERHQLRSDAADDFRIENPADVLMAREGAIRTLSVLLISIASVSLVVGGISIMNVMLVSVMERTREIGLRLALGARRRDIAGQFLTEAVALAVVGGILGVVVGSISAGLIAWGAGWPILISPLAASLACGFAGVVGVASGLYPAYRASQLDPIVALRFE